GGGNCHIHNDSRSGKECIDRDVQHHYNRHLCSWEKSRFQLNYVYGYGEPACWFRPIRLPLLDQRGSRNDQFHQYHPRQQQWILANWTSPTIQPGTASAAVIYIGASCEACTYNGLFGLFQEFVPGHTYTITITTKLQNQFTFNVTA